MGIFFSLLMEQLADVLVRHGEIDDADDSPTASCSIDSPTNPDGSGGGEDGMLLWVRG